MTCLNQASWEVPANRRLKDLLFNDCYLKSMMIRLLTTSSLQVASMRPNKASLWFSFVKSSSRSRRSFCFFVVLQSSLKILEREDAVSVETACSSLYLLCLRPSVLTLKALNVRLTTNW